MGGASDEVETMHLTENGWVDGGGKYDFGRVVEDIVPEGAVLSITKHSWCGALGAPSSAGCNFHEKERTDDTDLLKKLKVQHGKPTFSI